VSVGASMAPHFNLRYASVDLRTRDKIQSGCEIALVLHTRSEFCGFGGNRTHIKSLGNFYSIH
jgi:hypothetical protein